MYNPNVMLLKMAAIQVFLVKSETEDIDTLKNHS
jgi:hypothetical protein